MAPYWTELRSGLLCAVGARADGLDLSQLQLRTIAAAARGPQAPSLALVSLRGPDDLLWLEELDRLADDLHPDLIRGLAVAWGERAAGAMRQVFGFARLGLQLMSIGAPALHIEAIGRAQTEMLHHTRVLYAIATTCSGAVMRPQPIALQPADVSTDRVDIIRHLVGECALDATLGASRAHATATVTTPRLIREALEELAQDQAQHARAAWGAAAWLLAINPGLRHAAERAVRAPPHGAYRPAPPGSRGLGFLTAAEDSRITSATWRSVIVPCANALFEGCPVAPQNEAAAG